MARATAIHTIMDGGRDQGKAFVLTELPASAAEAWAMRAILALMQSGVNLPDGFERTGMAGIAEIGFKALSGLQWEIAKPLLDEMWDCVKFLPDPKKPQMVRALIEEDIEEIATRLKLRWEVFQLHVGFLKAAVLSTSEKLTAASKSPLPNT